MLAGEFNRRRAGAISEADASIVAMPKSDLQGVGNAPSGYKRTEMGDIPEDWDMRMIAEISRVTSGKRLPVGSSLVVHPTPHPYIRVTDMRPGTVSLTDIRFVPVSVFPKVNRYRIFRDDIFISVAGTLGIVGKIPPELDGANLTENANRITDIKCVPDFLMYGLMSPIVQNVIKSFQTVGAQPKLALMRIRGFEIPIPSSAAEQRVIAEALSDVDALLGSLDALIAKKLAIKQAAMQQLLTGKTRLPSFTGEWTIANLARDSVLKARIGWQGLTTAEYLSSGQYYLVTGTDFDDGQIEWGSCCYVSRERYLQDRHIQLKVGDVLLTKDGTIGKVGYVAQLPGPATLNSGVFVIRPTSDKCVPLYLFYVLTSRVFLDFLRRLKAGSTISHLYQKDFVDFEFAAPELDEQIAIATVLSDIDAEIAALRERRNKTQNLHQAMMQELLTGKTRLITPETADD